jgi:hypothetical protein
MRKQRVVSFMLVAALVAGCAAHREGRNDWRIPTTADGRVLATDDEVGAIAANIWYAPGRAFLCAGSAISAGLVMTLTLGQSYDSASELMHGGCSDPWIVRPADIRQAVP